MKRRIGIILRDVFLVLPAFICLAIPFIIIDSILILCHKTRRRLTK